MGLRRAFLALAREGGIVQDAMFLRGQRSGSAQALVFQ